MPATKNRLPDPEKQVFGKKMNGKRFISFAADHQLRICTNDEICEKKWTRARGEKRPTINYVLCSELLYDLVEKDTIHDCAGISKGSEQT